MKKKFFCLSVLVLFLISSPYFTSQIISAAESYELNIAEGIEKLNESKYKEALESLNKALAISPDNLEALYYAGVAYTRLGNIEKAKEVFLKIIKEDESFANVYLELGRIYYIQSDCPSTRQYLSSFLNLADDELLKAYAADLMGACAEEQVKPYNLHVSLGSQYDDNVLIEPSNPVAPVDAKDDGRVVAYVIADATLLDNENMSFNTEYTFYQSLHFSLDNFDVHYHRIKPSIDFKTFDALTTTLGYAFDYTLLGGDRYSGVNTYFANINIMENENFSTDLISEYKDFKYSDTDLFATNAIRSGHQTTYGLKQNFRKGDLSGNIFYFSDFGRASVEYWSFNGHRLGVELTYRATSPFFLTFFGEYAESDYREVFPNFTEERDDKVQKYSVILAYKITDRMALYLSDDFTVNDSNLSPFDYKRNIIGFYLTASIL
jgi:hypothetical protein